ncbi:MAG: hypothetical protein ACO3SO_11985 [Luteolibacter sp.]
MSADIDQLEHEAVAKEKKLKDYERPLFLVCAICGLGPFALPFILRHPRIKWYWKLCMSAGVIVLTWACIVLTRIMIEHLKQQWEMIQRLS